LNCRVNDLLLARYFDDEVSEAEHELVSVELRRCSCCRRRYDGLISTRTVLRTGFQHIVRNAPVQAIWPPEGFTHYKPFHQDSPLRSVNFSFHSFLSRRLFPVALVLSVLLTCLTLTILTPSDVVSQPPVPVTGLVDAENGTALTRKTDCTGVDATSCSQLFKRRPSDGQEGFVDEPYELIASFHH
jgi:hypothetical protein